MKPKVAVEMPASAHLLGIVNFPTILIKPISVHLPTSMTMLNMCGLKHCRDREQASSRYKLYSAENVIAACSCLSAAPALQNFAEHCLLVAGASIDIVHKLVSQLLHLQRTKAVIRS